MRKFFLVAAAAAIALVGVSAGACDSGEKAETSAPATEPETTPAPEVQPETPEPPAE